MLKRLKRLIQSLTDQPSEEEMREILAMFRKIPQINSPDDAFIVGGLSPLLPQPALTRLDN